MNEMLLLRGDDSGDWYSYPYAVAMCEAIASRPWTICFKYTKNIKWLARLREEGRLPANYRLVQSVGGQQDHLIDERYPHAKVFATHEDRIAAGYVDGTESDIPAIEGVVKIGLVYHGSENVADLDKGNLTDRGGLTHYGDGRYRVVVQLGLKNRRNLTFDFDLSDVSGYELHALVSLKTGNRKVKKTATKLSEKHGIKYRPASIGLPALATCPNAKACSGFCYAMQGLYGMPTHAKKRALLWVVYREAQRRGVLVDTIGRQLDTIAPRSVKRQLLAA